MKTLNITFSDEIHAKLLELKEIYGMDNLNETVAEVVRRQHEKETER